MIKSESGIGHVAVIAVVVVMGVVGFAGYNVYSQSSEQQSIDTVETESLDAVEELDLDTVGVLSIEEIETIATGDEGSEDANVEELELEQDSDGPVYVVVLSNGKKLVIDAKTGTIKSRANINAVNRSDSDDDSISKFAPFDTIVSLSEAKEIAQAELPDGKIVKVELENDDGILVYSVRFSQNGRVDVDASNGDVVRVENIKDGSRSEKSKDQDLDEDYEQKHEEDEKDDDDLDEEVDET